MDNNWIDIRQQLPPDKTWVQAIYRVPKTNYDIEMEEWFYWSQDDFWKGRITHWRFITHSFFNPVVDNNVKLELNK